MKRSKTVDIIISLICALTLWIYVVTVVTPEDDMTISDIPIVFSGEQEMRAERSLLISNKTASTVSVKFHGSRADLKRLERNRSDLTAVVDTSTFTAEREYASGYEIVLPTALQDQAIQIVDRTPKTVRFTVEKLASKPIPVKGIFDGTIANGFEAGELTFDLDSVTVSGPSEQVNLVQYAQALIDGSRVSETFSEVVSLTLVDADGNAIHSPDLTLNETEIKATQQILMQKEVPVTLSVLPGGGANEGNTEIELSLDKVILRGEKRVLDEIEMLDAGELDLGLIEADETRTYDLIAPENTELVSEETTVSAVITFRDLNKASFSVSEFRADHVEENADENLKVRFVTQSLEVTLRGPEASLSEISENDLIAFADLTDYTKPGAFTVPVTIQTGKADVGAVGEYTVELELYVDG